MSTLVYDSTDERLPKRFRTTASLGNAFLPKMIGSGQFSLDQWKAIRDEVGEAKILVVDLREESHGFVGKKAVSWYAKQNAGNRGLSLVEIEREEEKQLGRLSTSLEPVSISKILKKSPEGDILEAEIFQVKAQQSKTEKTNFNEAGVNYVRLPITDHEAMRKEWLNDWLQVLGQLQSTTWIYFHCRGGSGRTTQAMVLADIWWNAQNNSLGEILDRQQALGGKDLSALPEKTSYKYEPAKARLKFVEDFYQFVKANTNRSRI